MDNNDNTTIEQWRDIPGYEGIYQASNQGRIRSVIARNRHQPKILTPAVNNRGYSRITLSRDRHVSIRLVHNLVMEAFIGKCPSGYEVNHINNIRLDNRLGNLEYVTRSQNTLHKFAMGYKAPRGETHGQSKLTTGEVIEIRRLLKNGQSLLSIATQFGVHRSTVQRIASGQGWKHVTENNEVDAELVAFCAARDAEHLATMEADWIQRGDQVAPGHSAYRTVQAIERAGYTAIVFDGSSPDFSWDVVHAHIRANWKPGGAA